MPAIGGDGNSIWVGRVLDGIHAARTSNNIAALSMWAQSEAMPGWTYNWLAATQPVSGAKEYNGSGVKVYPTADAGITATVHTLLLPPYAPIVRALKGKASLAALFDAINTSPWCAGCDGGRYPAVLWAATYGKGQGTPGGAPRSDSPPEWDWSAKVHAAANQFSAAATGPADAARAIRSLPT